MEKQDAALMAHLMRRAGFGAPQEEIEARVANGYEATVEELLHPEDQPDGLEMDVLERYFVEWRDFLAAGPAYMAWRLINSNRPLQEKMTLFWHGVLCTANSKLENQITQKMYFEMLRNCGMGNFRDLLMEISKDPSMVYYLDNCLSHKDAINENWGRELLELFSMGVGMDGQFNYTEEDVKECSRAFTGWTLANSIPVFPYGRYEARFVYNPEDHDDGEKTFLGGDRPLQRRGRHRYYCQTARDGEVRVSSPLQLLRSRRRSGPILDRNPSPGCGHHQDAGGGILPLRLQH